MDASPAIRAFLRTWRSGKALVKKQHLPHYFMATEDEKKRTEETIKRLQEAVRERKEKKSREKKDN